VSFPDLLVVSAVSCNTVVLGRRVVDPEQSDTVLSSAYMSSCVWQLLTLSEGRLLNNFANRGSSARASHGRDKRRGKRQMKFIKKVLPVLGLFAALGLLPPRAAADDMNKKTIVTFSEPVEVPGVGAQVLPAGTYVFKLMDSPSDRNIVQIFNQDETHVYTTILAIANYRLRPTDKTVMTFRERASGQPEALRAWFYPGANWGQEFVYPKVRAVELAKVTHATVLETPVDLTAVPVETLATVPVEAVEPTGETIEVAKVVESPPPTAATNELPQTASPLALYGLIGFLSISMALVASMLLKRVI